MIGLLDSLTLVRAKLHSKRILLLGTIIISGLLFAVLYGSIVIFDGITKSANDYTRKALDGKYLVKSTPVLPPNIFGPSRVDVPDEVIAQLNTLQTEYIAQQKSRAASLKLTFDEKSISAVLVPDPYTPKDSSGRQRLMINDESPVFQIYVQKLQQDYVKKAKNKLVDLQAAARPYHATAFNQNLTAATSYLTMRYLKDGKEEISDLNNLTPNSGDASAYGFMTSSVRNSLYSFVDQSLVKRFILSANEKRNRNSTAIPVIITDKEAVEVFGKKLGIKEKTEKATDQIAWMKDLQEKINGFTYTACYRNQADVTRVTKVAQTLTEIEQHKTDKTYKKPSLIYALPTEACGDIQVSQDMRSNAEKTEDAKQEEISKKLGTYQEPTRQLITFQIVGIMPTAPPQSAITSFPAFLADLLSAHYGAGAIIPQQMYDQLPPDAQHKTLLQNGDTSTLSLQPLQNAGIGETIVTFSSIDQARVFMHEQGCPTQDNCGKPFALEAYGSNYLLMDDFQAVLTRFLSYALLGGMVIATIIIWFMMTRVIIDSRRETAVFRAIGAKRRDIVGIYLLYSSAVALQIITFALAIGLGGALIIQLLYSTDATNYAQVSYGIFEEMEPFNLVSFTSPLLLWITLGIVGVSIVAVMPPLIRNVRRNPIQDMREE